MISRLSILALVAVLGLAGCGGDDETTTTSSTTTTTTSTGATGASGASGEEGEQPDEGVAGDPRERSDEITSCLEDDGYTVTENKGTAGADFHLVVDAGFAGVVYVFADDAAAKSGLSAVESSESGAGRDVEQLGDVVIGWMKASERTDLEACVEG